MSMQTVESVDGPRGYIPINIGNALGQTQTVTTQEVSTEVNSRGYRMAISLPVSPPYTLPPISPPAGIPTITRAQAIKAGVDTSLVSYSMALRCTRIGGCSISEARYNGVVTRAAQFATQFLRAGSIATRSPSISPLPALSPVPVWTRVSLGHLSPRLRGIGGDLYGLGQDEHRDAGA